MRQQEELRETPLVVYTIHDLNGDERARLTLGETEFLTKSRAAPEEFERVVVNLLNRIMANKEEALGVN